MTEATRAKLPRHLLQFVVDQNYARYTPEDQATWRFVMRQLREYLKVHAHPTYLDGLEKTGISPEQIPRITDIDRNLEAYGWGAVPVSGFIPPAAFMEFQSLGILPVASDVRSLEHWLYTPAPDIVHEAAGHAPLLIHPDFSAYLRRYGEVARHSILSREDLDQYEAIRDLSDLKENRFATPDEVARAERRLAEVNARFTELSEATLLSRMNWWTVEYGLIGTLDRPRLFGAGLLSSVGEARTCLSKDVQKLPLTVDCVNFAYDITEPQPHLFVTPDFETLTTVLNELAEGLSYRRGGTFGLDRARRARTVNTATLDSGVQISGRLEEVVCDAADRPAFLKFSGPCQLSYAYAELPGQGVARHAAGYSTPIGPLRGAKTSLDQYTAAERASLGRLEFDSGVVIEGRVIHQEVRADRVIYLTWADCRVTHGATVLFEPAWGEYDQAVGLAVPSVFGGAADRVRFGDHDAAPVKTVPARATSAAEARRFALYQDIRDLRERGRGDLDELVARLLTEPGDEWLLALELAEIAARAGRVIPALTMKLDPATRDSSTTRLALELGLRLSLS